MKKWTAWILSLILTVGILSGCSKDPETSGSSGEVKSLPEREGVLKMASLSPYKSSKEGASLVFDYLTRLDSSYEAGPNLVTEWKASDDFMEYELTIRKDVNFHDGTPLTAEIVKWNIEKGGEINYCSYSYVLDSVEVIDPEHLRVKLSAPYLYLEKDLGLIPCIPVGGYSEEGKFNTHVGTGAFRLESTDAGEVSTLLRNENYWKRDFETDVQKIE